MKTTVIKGKPIAPFDEHLLKIIRCEETSMRQVEKFDWRIGIRNDHQQLYRMIGIADDETFFNLCDYLKSIGFTDELDDASTKQGCQSILSISPKIKWVFEEGNEKSPAETNTNRL